MDCLICSTDGTKGVKGKKGEERDGGEDGNEWDEGTKEPNSANIYEKICANIYVNIRGAKNSAQNCASVKFPHICS